MGVARATTPTFTLTFSEEELNLTTASNVYVTFEQDGVSITKTGADLTIGEKQIDVYLDQAETLNFKVGVVDVQANWTMAGGRRASSEVAQIQMTKQLLRQVVE